MNSLMGIRIRRWSSGSKSRGVAGRAGGGGKWGSPLTSGSLHESVVKRQRLDNGGVRLGALLELLQSQLPVGVLRKGWGGGEGVNVRRRGRGRPQRLPVEMPEFPVGGKRGSGGTAVALGSGRLG